MRSYISLDGILSYLENTDNGLFDNIEIPADIDKNILINTIYQKGAEFGVIYSDPIFLKESVNNWFKSHYFTFNKWANAITAEYNITENYDRYEESSDTSSSRASSENTLNQSDNTNNESKVAAYDSSTYQPESNSTAAGTTNSRAAGSNTMNDSASHNSHIHGNIGVTTASAMIAESMRLYGLYNIYELIADMFCDEYLIEVY